MSAGRGSAPLNAAERAELERFRMIAEHADHDSGAIAGISAAGRGDRIDTIAHGIQSLSVIFGSAMAAPHEQRATALGWEGAWGLLHMLARDFSHEGGALWDEVRRSRDRVQSAGSWIADELDNIATSLAEFQKSGDVNEIDAALVNLEHARNGLADIREVSP